MDIFALWYCLSFLGSRRPRRRKGTEVPPNDASSYLALLQLIGPNLRLWSHSTTVIFSIKYCPSFRGSRRPRRRKGTEVPPNDASSYLALLQIIGREPEIQVSIHQVFWSGLVLDRSPLRTCFVT